MIVLRAEQFQVAYEARVDVGALRQKRVANAQRRRGEAQLDALLVWKDENVRYLTDLRPQLIAGKTTALNGALLIADHPPILFARAANAIAPSERCRGSRKSTQSRSSRSVR